MLTLSLTQFFELLLGTSYFRAQSHEFCIAVLLDCLTCFSQEVAGLFSVVGCCFLLSILAFSAVSFMHSARASQQVSTHIMQMTQPLLACKPVHWLPMSIVI